MIERFPTINSTVSPDALGKFIQQQYGLSNNTTCSVFRLAMNHLYIVQDRKKKYVFRVYTYKWRTRLEVEEELKLLLHLQEATANVAYPIADNSNNYIQEIEAPEGKRFGVLFSYASGSKTARFSSETSYLIGQALAKVHQSTEGFTLLRTSYDNVNLLESPLETIKAFFPKTNAEIDFLQKLVALVRQKIDGVDKQKIRFGAVHLDVWFDNLHIDKEEEITFFDFDFCGNGYLCFDISYFLYQLLATNLNEEEYKLKADSFLKGYESLIEISDEEKKFLPFACLAIMTYYIGVQCDRFEYWTNIFLNEDHLKRMTGNMKRWMAYNEIKVQ
jgi:Ser/Thr protein kinase RdoA (MazF antagonist)